MQRLEDYVNAPYRWLQRHPFAWPVVMVLIGLGAFAAARIVSPGPDEWSYLLGQRLGGSCGFQDATGLPCPSCGMTRSWTHLARGYVVEAFTYNAAGAILLISLWLTALLGAVRLAFRDPEKFKVPASWLTGLVIVWMLGPYTVLWVARLFGINPLP